MVGWFLVVPLWQWLVALVIFLVIGQILLFVLDTWLPFSWDIPNLLVAGFIGFCTLMGFICGCATILKLVLMAIGLLASMLA